VHGFEAVADVGQRAAHDDAHGVIEVGAPHFVFDIDRDVVFVAAIPPPAPGNGTGPPGRRGWALRWKFLICQSGSSFGGKCYFTKNLVVNERPVKMAGGKVWGGRLEEWQRAGLRELRNKADLGLRLLIRWGGAGSGALSAGDRADRTAFHGVFLIEALKFLEARVVVAVDGIDAALEAIEDAVGEIEDAALGMFIGDSRLCCSWFCTARGRLRRD